MHIKEAKNKLKNGLYIVSTPIGNLGDITIRALEVLERSNVILCEDTRVSKKILTKFKISSKLIAYHKFNENKNLQKIISILKTNNIVAMISDAGTPTISDPGKILINECVKNKINIFPIPGASAPSAAISISGFSDKYYFHGFLPEKKNEIIKDLKFLSKINSSLIFFISAKKLNRLVEPFIFYLCDRDMVICKEITKMYEEYFRFPVKDLNRFNTNIKGEITLVVSQKINNVNNIEILSESDKVKIKNLIYKLSVKDIVSLICDGKNISKKIIYDYCIRLKNEN